MKCIHINKIWFIMRFMTVLGVGIMLTPQRVDAAKGVYATYVEPSKVYKIGKHKYTYEVKGDYGIGDPYDNIVTLYEVRHGKKVKISKIKALGVLRMAEYKNMLYYSYDTQRSVVSQLFRYNRKTKITEKVADNVGQFLFYKKRLYTVESAQNIYPVNLYVSNLDGFGQRLITKQSVPASIGKIYGNRLYFIQVKWDDPNWSDGIAYRIASCDLNGNKLKTYGKWRKNRIIIYYDNTKYIYEKTKYNSDFTVKSVKYYQVNLKTQKQKRIYPSKKQLSKWEKLNLEKLL